MKKHASSLLVFALVLILQGCTVPDPFNGLLISGSDLEHQLGLDNLIIIDARTSGYESGHIPGAVNLKWPDHVDDAKNLLSISELEAKLGAAGLTRTATYVIYDDTTASWGASGRVFWMLEYLGCPNVHVLNGGWDKWSADGRQTETSSNTLPAATFTATENSSIVMDKDTLAAKMDNDDFIIIDSRTDAEYNGWTFHSEPRGGHIPGAVQIPYARFFQSDKTILELADLKALFESYNITPDKEVTSYCTAGIRSAFVYFCLRVLGYPAASNYDGSIREWGADSSLAMDSLTNYQTLVTAGWVQDLIDGNSPATYDGNDYVILECSYDKDNGTGFIPGAVSIHPCYMESKNNSAIYYPSYSTPDDGNLLPGDELQAALADLGITSDTLVIVYGNGRIIPMTSCRVAWSLMYAGVKDVRILNGGFTAWTGNGGTIVDEPAEPAPAAAFGDVPTRPELLASTAYVEDISEGTNTDSVLVDVRGLDEYTGTKQDLYPFFLETGHIPGAIWNDNWTVLVDMDDDTMRCYTEVAAHWEDLDITSAVEPIFYCGTGWRSTIGFFHAYLMGYPAMRNYDGSLYEWSFDGTRPISADQP